MRNILVEKPEIGFQCLYTAPENGGLNIRKQLYGSVHQLCNPRAGSATVSGLHVGPPSGAVDVGSEKLADVFLCDSRDRLRRSAGRRARNTVKIRKQPGRHGPARNRAESVSRPPATVSDLAPTIWEPGPASRMAL